MRAALCLDTDLLIPNTWRAAAAAGPVHAFNPTLFADGDGYLLAYRLCFADERRRIALCRLDDGLDVVPDSPVAFCDHVRATRPDVAAWFADPRFVVVAGALHLYWNSGNELPENRQYLVAVDPATLRPIGPVRELVLDGPRRRIEKNWTFFEADGLHCLYSADPHRVLRVVEEAGRWVARDVAPPIGFVAEADVGEAFRGGAAAVRVGDAFHLFGHSRRSTPDGAVYQGALLVLSARPPFAAVAATRDALPGLPGRPRRLPPLNRAVRSVIYPSGAVREEGGWLLSYGVDDEAVALARLSDEHIAAVLDRVPAAAADPAPSSPAVSTWMDDRFWRRAAALVLVLARRFRHVLVPGDLVGLAANCLPLDFAFAVDPEEVAVVAPKDDFDRLPLAWLKRLGAFRVLHVDEVFAAVALRPNGAPEAPPASRLRHLPYLTDRVARILAGTPVRRSRIEVRLSTRPDGAPYGLLVAAVLTDNAGDPLMVSAALTLLAAAFPGLTWVVAGTEVDRTLVADASLVVLGPGGFLYDVTAAAADLANLAHYAKFGFLAEEYGKPFVGLGLGHQTVATRLGRRFLAAAFARARLVTVRDPDTARLLGALDPALRLVTTPDLSFVLHREIAELEPERGIDARPVIVLCGAFDRDPLAAALLARIERLLPAVRLRIVVQAREDAEWVTALSGDAFARLGAPETIDARELMPAAFLRAVAGGDAVVTTRFHATMVALLAGRPTLVVGGAGGKHDRGLAALPPTPVRFLPSEATDPARLDAAVDAFLADLAAFRRRPVAAEPGVAEVLATFDEVITALAAIDVGRTREPADPTTAREVEWS